MGETISSEIYKGKAKAAATKVAALGGDIDLSKYVSSAEGPPYQADPSRFSVMAKKQMLKVGVILDDVSQRAGTFIQMDNTPVHSSTRQECVEVMTVSQALKEYGWLSDYWWRAVEVDTDKYTANVELNQHDGYFIRTLPGSKTIYPVQACLYLSKAGLAQNVHNIIIAEENSELHIITGCTSASADEPGIHMGVSELMPILITPKSDIKSFRTLPASHSEGSSEITWKQVPQLRRTNGRVISALKA